MLRMSAPTPTHSSLKDWDTHITPDECNDVCLWADILLDVIGGVESALREGCPRTLTDVSQHWFSGHFRQVFSTPMHYPALTLAPTCGANRAS